MLGLRQSQVSIDSIGLGPLEGRVMDVIWERGASSVRDVMPHLGPLAYPTVMTTMVRLHKKGFLDRDKKSRNFVYRPRFTKEMLRRKFTEDFLLSFSQSLTTGPLVSCLLDAVQVGDEAVLDDLERMIRRKREELDRTRQEQVDPKIGGSATTRS